MEIASKITEVRERVRAARLQNKSVGFVPTMGYLHDGHLSLIEISKRFTQYQVMSIFVNRIQFNDAKDFSSYPKNFERDFALARSVATDLIFVPDEKEMYSNQMTSVDVAGLTEHLCGAHRPGHFRGVYTVVSKLFNIVQPDVAVFGQKDIQQAVSIEKMVNDLNFPVRIIIAPTVREKDGLAMSSRNTHLNPEQRRNALCVWGSLRKAEEMILSGEKKAGPIIAAMENVLHAGRPDGIDYVSAVRYKDLAPAEIIDEKSVIAVAAFFGTTRLIDNMIVEFESGGPKCVY